MEAEKKPKELKKMSTISVLVPIHCKEKKETIRSCLLSMVSQTVKPDEIVCVLDKPSTEEIETVIDEVADKTGIRVVKCYCERGSGLGAVLNIGVKNCSCDYIARMDADDIAVPERLEKERNYLDKNQDIDVVGSNIAEFESSPDCIIAYRNVPADDLSCKVMLKRRDPINHMSAMYRRESVIKAGNYSKEMRSCEDTHLWTSFYATGLKFANIQENLVLVHAGREMYARRGGKKSYEYVKKAIDYKYSVRLISRAESILQKTANYCVLVLMSNNMRAFIYAKILRNKSNKE